jgi:hypothetical protein
MSWWARIQQQSWTNPQYYPIPSTNMGMMQNRSRNLWQTQTFLPRSATINRWNSQVGMVGRTGSLGRSTTGLNRQYPRLDRKYSIRYQTELHRSYRTSTMELSKFSYKIPKSTGSGVPPTGPGWWSRAGHEKLTTHISMTRRYLKKLTTQGGLEGGGRPSQLGRQVGQSRNPQVARRSSLGHSRLPGNRSGVQNGALIPKTSSGLSKTMTARQGNQLGRRLQTGKRTTIQLEGRMNFNCAQCHAPGRPPTSPVGQPQTPRLPTSPVLVRWPLTLPLIPSGLQRPMILPRSAVVSLQLPSTPLDPSLIALARRLVPPSRVSENPRSRESDRPETPAPSRATHAHEDLPVALSEVEPPLMAPALPALAASPVQQLPALSPSPITAADASESTEDQGVVFRPPPLPPLPVAAS